MKKSVFSFAIISMLSVFALKAQDCVYYFPTNEGASVETSSYDSKGTLTGINVQRIIKKDVTNNETKITVTSDSYETNGVKKATATLDYYCRAGVFYIDMKKILDPAMISQYQGMDVKFATTDCSMPGVLVAGQSLPESSVTMEVSNAGMMMMTFNIRIYNRKVVSVETINTNMGPYECFKITYDVETNMGMGMIFKTTGTDWYAKNVGAVKTESYDSNGKLTNYTLLTKFKN
ncbi:MAG: hypothetical protein WCQ95_01565 [Bacteroidota bacterium]